MYRGIASLATLSKFVVTLSKLFSVELPPEELLFLLARLVIR